MGSNLFALLELASEAGGLITTHAALERGISRRALAGMTQRGLIEHVSRGVYRLVHSQADPFASYRTVIMWAQAHRGPRVALSHETALTILALSDANPSQIHLTIPSDVRFRRHLPTRVTIHRAPLDDKDVMEHEGLQLTSFSRTVIDVARSGNMRFAGDAIIQGRREGYITERESKRLTAELEQILHGTGAAG